MKISSLIILLTICFVKINVCADSTYTDLWKTYFELFKDAKHIDLTHAFEPVQPVWSGFGNAKFKAAVAGKAIDGFVHVGEEFTYDKHGFVATAYELPSDQYGTQLDPPAHWNKFGATTSDLPPTYAVRPLVVIDIHEKVTSNEGYHLQLDDITNWESKHGIIPEGSVVMVRTDWYKKWNDIDRFDKKPFPGISLSALQFLHTKRKILFHGHETLDTDTTSNLDGEFWLMHNNFTQAEGVANLDQVPEAGALIVIGYSKPQGGTGSYARYIAIAPKEWKYGVSIRDVPGAPLAEQIYPLARDKNGVMRPTHATQTTIKEDKIISSFDLKQNFPNPFNPNTTINYELPQNSNVKIIIYDGTGRLIRELLNEYLSAGKHSVVWNGKDKSGKTVASGNYFYQIESGNNVQSMKMILIK